MTTSTQPREEVFPGYLLTERLGSGGYAEVWRARAPGGIDKAVKVVYGYYDEQLASQEMKAMERIKDVRHPFVLSLERFEVVDGRLVILTELADMSLEQRAQQCRAQGLPGIPREELLRYLADAAEALDYLAQRHSLQHLDIKPANLLISGEHVKVADFGLVKELASRTHNSMVAGMTPTYSSPEMFDDAPSPHSDQYSLAIVYQEMLTGVLPFPGKTTAQLANQHLRTPPQLAALAESDRPAVAKALAKTPADRYPSCRAFVKSLCDMGSRLIIQANEPKAVNGHDAHLSGGEAFTSRVATMPRGAKDASSFSSAESDDRAMQPTEQQTHGAIDTQLERPSVGSFKFDRTVVDVAVPESTPAHDAAPPTLYIAAGGVGVRVLNELRDSLLRRGDAMQTSTAVEMIAVDTDRLEIKEACSSRWNDPLPANDALCLPLRLPQEYRENSRDNFEWLSHRWLYNIPRSLETRGYRPLGRLGLVDHVDKVLSLIDRKLKQLTASKAESNPDEPSEIRVVVLAGMGGGTGSGIAIDLANAARSRIESVGHRASIQGVFVCTSLGNASASPLSVANTYAFLAELQHATEFGNQAPSANKDRSRELESAGRPFDLVYCIPAKQRSGEAADDATCSIAKQLFLTVIDGAREVFSNCQKASTPREMAGAEPLLLRSLGSAALSGPKQHRIELLAKRLAAALERYWLADVGASEWSKLTRSRDSEPALRNPPAETEQESTASKPVSPQMLAERLRADLGNHASTRLAFEIASRVSRQAALRGAYRAGLQSSNDPSKVVAAASQVISSIMARQCASLPNDKASSSEDEAIIKSVVSASNRVLTKVVDEIDRLSANSSFDVAKLDQAIKLECTALAAEFLGRPSGGNVALSPDLEAGVRQTLDEASIDLLQCGHDRRTLVFVPRTDPECNLIRDLATVRPEIATIPASVDEAVVFCEGSGISSTAFLQGLERVYPDIAEAASRFFTRIDINWRARRS